MIKSKSCRLCHVDFELSFNNFFKKKSSKDGFSSSCKKCDYQRKIKWNKANPEKQKEIAKRSLHKLKNTDPLYQSNYRKKKLLQIKEIVFKAYGNECACCGEKTFDFLSLDHIYGDGKAHRDKYKNSSFRTINVYQDIIDQNFPPVYQILCYNCHFAKDFYGKCPHPDGVERKYEKNIKK